MKGFIIVNGLRIFMKKRRKDNFECVGIIFCDDVFCLFWFKCVIYKPLLVVFFCVFYVCQPFSVDRAFCYDKIYVKK